MGSPYLVIISRFLTLRRCFRLLPRKIGGARAHCVYFLIFFKDERQEDREKGMEKWLKCFTSHRALSLQWPLVGGQIDPGNKGSFPQPVYLFTLHCHQSETHTHTQKLTQLYPQRANVREGWVIQVFTVTTSNELVCVYSMCVLASPTAVALMTFYSLNFEPNKPFQLLSLSLWKYTVSLKQKRIINKMSLLNGLSDSSDDFGWVCVCLCI